MNVSIADQRQEWDAFLLSQPFRPFLQSWTMGEVYRDTGQEPVRLVAKNDDGSVAGICMALIVPARRGRHLSIPYGPVLASLDVLGPLLEVLKKQAAAHRCTFIRMSPFAEVAQTSAWASVIGAHGLRSVASPLHLLAEHLWCLPLMKPTDGTGGCSARTEEEILMEMRKTTRNLVRRAERDGITVTASTDPLRDVEAFITLHDETRKRHHFTPYTNNFFRAQVRRFSEDDHCTVYVARHEGKILASSIHMHFGGETSYHHGASLQSQLPVSYALQWKAITDALARGDHLYNFWGIAPLSEHTPVEGGNPKSEILNPKHPFAGVTLFKTGFGGQVRELMHCTDLPLAPSYRITRLFEQLRKWKRGF